MLWRRLDLVDLAWRLMEVSELEEEDRERRRKME
jgi:hypothetical protein